MSTEYSKTRVAQLADESREPSLEGRPDSDAMLVARAKSGDLGSLDLLIGQHRSRVLRIALRMMRNKEDAEDVVQNTCLQVHRNLMYFKGNARFSTWLGSIAVNEALMSLRKRRVLLVSLDEDGGPEDHSPRQDPPDWRANPEQVYWKVEITTVLYDAVNQLPFPLRTPFVLRHLCELTFEETAKILGISVVAAKSKVFRARCHIRGQLSNPFAPGARN
jgi:RNA polymerase sigma-70 factor (ECF subfamily)